MVRRRVATHTHRRLRGTFKLPTEGTPPQPSTSPWRTAPRRRRRFTSSSPRPEATPRQCTTSPAGNSKGLSRFTKGSSAAAAARGNLVCNQQQRRGNALTWRERWRCFERRHLKGWARRPRRSKRSRGRSRQRLTTKGGGARGRRRRRIWTLRVFRKRCGRSWPPSRSQRRGEKERKRPQQGRSQPPLSWPANLVAPPTHTAGATPAVVAAVSPSLQRRKLVRCSVGYLHS
mmetsp:Transcript_6050/g.12574  ORF Transcript_6050/g.12574 Transcript_6050/m.12574 type:complete len:231 (+) Transcript_6050:226-918(+)